FFGEAVSQIYLLDPNFLNLAIYIIGPYRAIDMNDRILLFEDSSKFIILFAAAINAFHEVASRKFSQLKMRGGCSEEYRMNHSLDSAMRANNALKFRSD